MCRFISDLTAETFVLMAEISLKNWRTRMKEFDPQSMDLRNQGCGYICPNSGGDFLN